MIWWGYAGLSAAIVFSLVLIALIVGVSTEDILALVANTGAALLALGAFVHLCAIIVRNNRRRPTH
jgi:hypothetical protein